MSIRAAALFTILLLVGCGGGGGGSSSEAFKITFSASSLTATLEQDELSSYPTVQLSATSSGDPGTTVHVSVALDAATFANGDIGFLSANQATLTARVRNDLTVGTHSGTNTINVCGDSACNKHLANSPYRIPYTITVRPGFRVSTAQIAWVANAGEVPSAQYVSVQLPEGFDDFNLATPVDTDWLQLIKESNQGFSVSALAVRPGVYYARVLVKTMDDSRSLPVDINYEVRGSDNVVDLSAGIASASVPVPEGGTGQLDFAVTLPTWSNTLTFSYTYATDGDWMQASRLDDSQVRLTVSAVDRGIGNYTGTLTLASGPTSTPVNIPVTMVVGESLAVVGPTALTINAQTQETELSRAFDIQSTDSRVIGWQAQTTTPWLDIETTNGTTGTELRYSIDKAAIAALTGNGELVGSIQLTPEDDGLTPVTIDIHVNVELPRLKALSQASVVANRPQRLILLGEHLDQLVSDPTLLSLSSGQLVSINTMAGGNKLIAELGPLPQGDHAITVTNRLEVSSTSSTFVSLDPVSYGYEALPTKGKSRSVNYDEIRQIIYLSYDSLDELEKWSFTGSSWQSESKSIAGLVDAVLSTDRSTIYVLTTSSVIALDAATLTETGQWDHGWSVEGPWHQATKVAAFGNDGKVYFFADPQPSGYDRYIVYFDTKTNQFGTRHESLSHYDDYMLESARNGEQMAVSEVGETGVGIYLFTANPENEVTDLNVSKSQYFTSLSDFAERYSRDGIAVYDLSQSQTASYVDSAATERLVASELSPDGTRLYNFSAVYLNSAMQPRVYVVDSSVVTGASLPSLGYFELPEFPTCTPGSFGCNWIAASSISPDGETLFFAGENKLMIVPINSTLVTAAKSAPAWVKSIPAGQ